jgi:hypothetical protein
LVYPGAALLAASALTLGASLLRAWRFSRRALRDTEPPPAPAKVGRRAWHELNP